MRRTDSRWPEDLRPQIIDVAREGLSRETVARDLLSGVVVGIVALPLAIAFAIASGVRPEQGLYTAIVAGFAISLLSGSRYQIGGPTGAFVVLVLSIVQSHGYDGLVLATLMAGLLLVAMAFARLGSVIRFIPYPVTVGFTTGIAVVIAVGQVPEALGLTVGAAHSDFLPRLAEYGRALHTITPAAAGLTLLTVGAIRLTPRLARRVPGPLVGVVLATVAAHAFDLGVATVGSRFGEIPGGLPPFRIPRIDPTMVRDLVQPAMAIAILAGIESLLSAVVADGMTGGRHRANAELLAQGIANLASPFFGGIPATGAIARTATNVKNGGSTPIAGMTHAVVLVVILTSVGRWVALIPMSALAGVLLVVAWNMSEIGVFRSLLRGPRSDVLVLLSTFALTVLVDLVVAIEVGVVLASLLFMRRMGEVSSIRAVGGDRRAVAGERRTAERDRAVAGGDRRAPTESDAAVEEEALPPGALVYEVAGSFFFGSAQRFSEVLAEIDVAPTVVILRMRDVFVLDSTGLHALESVHDRLSRRGTRLILSGVRDQPLAVLERSGVGARFGAGNVLATYGEAVRTAWALYDDAGRDPSVPTRA